MFEYEFMQRALLAGILLGAAVPLVGTIIVVRRLSMIGDALSHASLAGVAGGLLAGVSPVLGATLASIAAASCVEFIRRKLAGHAELAIAIVMSLGVGLAGVIAGFLPNTTTFSSFLFGSIVTVSDEELASVVVICLGIMTCCFLFRRQLLLMALDERSARLSGVPVGLFSAAFILATALIVSIAARTVGSLIVSSLMVLPVAAALQVARSWKALTIISSGLGIASSVAGLILSYEYGSRPGGTIVLIAIALLFVCLGIRKGRDMMVHKSTSQHPIQGA